MAWFTPHLAPGTTAPPITPGSPGTGPALPPTTVPTLPTTPVTGLPGELVGQWDTIRHTWVGADSSVWTISDPAGGVLLTRGGVRGLGDAPVREYVDESPAMDGARWRGFVYDPRPVFWPLAMYVDTSSADWIKLHSDFKRSLSRRGVGLWIVEHPALGRRRLECRYVGDSDRTMERDPAFFGWDTFGVNLMAYNPYWLGDPIVRVWRTSAAVDFVGTTNGVRKGPPFYISSASHTGTAALTNPGDVDSYVVWTMVGPFNGGVLGVGSRTIEVPFGMPAGKALVVNPNPEYQTAMEAEVVATNDGPRYVQTGVERTGDLPSTADWEGSRVPATGLPVQLNASIDGTGSIRAELNPMYDHALAMARG
jgi:hypothetical protein